MSVLFYIEPVVFRRAPGLLRTWVDWVARIAAANPDERFGLVSSTSLLASLGSDSGVRGFEIPLATVLSTSDFSRVTYARNLFDPSPPVNPPLSAALRAIDEAFGPDVVVSFTQNPWLASAFSNAEVLFMELGVWPRLGVPGAFFLDRLGHQHGILNQAWARIDEANPPLTTAAADAIWAEHVREHNLEHPAHPLVRDWMAGLASRHRRVLALQPPDWLTYEGMVGPIAPEELICAEAFRDPDAVLIPTYHSQHRLDAAMEAHIAGEFPNVVFPPPELAAGVTELLVQLADEVVTISSTTAISAILSGTPVRVLGGAAFAQAARAMNAASGDPDEVSRLRRNILAFLSHRYLHPADRCLDGRDVFSQAIRELGGPDPVAPYLDFSTWREDRLRMLLGLTRPS